MSQPIEIKLPWPAKVLHSNASGKHWGPKARATAKARQEAAIMAKNAGVSCWPDASILIEYWPPHRKYDVQNIPSSLKASLDGIADAMGCSDKEFDVDYPRVFAGTKKGGEVVFRIYPNSLRAGT